MSNQHGPSRYRGFPRLRRVKPIPTALFSEYAKRDPNEPKESPSPTDSRTLGEITHSSLLRIWLKPPWEDYVGSGTESDSIALGSTAAEKPVLAFRRTSYFSKASIRAFPSSGGFKILEAISSVQHPNVAKLFDVYLYDNKVFVASEYLELSIDELDFHYPPFEEWEIATIANEVLKGSAYLRFKGVSCKMLSVSHIRISTEGAVKIALDLPQYEQKVDHTPEESHAILDLPCIIDIVQEMMLPRFHLKDSNESWSLTALDFLSCCISGSIECLGAHAFLGQAKSPNRLAPRIRFATEVLRLEPPHAFCGKEAP